MGTSAGGANVCYVPPSPPQPLQFPCVTETSLSAPTTTSTASTANAEFDTAALLRAWYEAGYAMGQAHAEQVPPLSCDYYIPVAFHLKNKLASIRSLSVNSLKAGN
ncbi:unnamed protein product [Dibothriocephalus latus]|uniref:Uncharacterized protein n=1 Tax=Dibothriocephalus latus TaxID=60516 RepID=A0A3P7MH40_DIBLA|nr:unnamed protein product [Dibothriocephalus latus]